LTSILFLPFYSNIIKAVRRVSEKETKMGEGENEGEEEKQFVTVYHFGRRKRRVCVAGSGERTNRIGLRKHVY
jgi:hypothetical protein